MSKMTVYDVITDALCKMLEKGTVPWKKTWDSESAMPCSLTTKKPYKGLNAIILGCLPYKSPYFVTWKGCTKLGGQVKEEEKHNSYPVVYWKVWEEEEKDPTTNQPTGNMVDRWTLRYYRVYNTDQTTGLDKHVPVRETKVVNTIEACEKVVAGYEKPPTITEGNGRDCCYRRGQDEVIVPRKDLFTSAEEFYASLFHELVHSTGHQTRLDRLTDDNFGGQDYSLEELTAEIGSAFLCGLTAISTKTIDNSASYIAGWLKALRSNPKWLVQAGSKAQKAVKWIVKEDAPTQEKEETNDV